MKPIRNTNHWTPISYAATACALALLSAGCGSAIHGSWKAPEAPDGAVQYITQAEFKENGDFVAAARNDAGEAETWRGKYEFDGVSLRLMQPRRPDAIYDAMYNAFNKSLKISREGRSQTLSKM